MSESYVIVHRSYDPIQAELIGELLRDAGVGARVTGTRSGAMIGVAQNILEVHIAVPASQAGQATDFLEAYFSDEAVADAIGRAKLEATDGADADGDDDADDGADADNGADHADDADPADDDRADGAGKRAAIRPLLAAGSAFLTFGVGHLYARRPATAIALLVGQLVAMGLLFLGTGWYEWTFGLTALGAIVACDLVGSMVAARAHRRGVRRSRAWQVGLGTVYVAGSLGLAQLLGPHLTDPTEGEPTGGWRRVQHQSPLERIDRPLEHDPSFPPLTSEHPANPSARHRP
ncbi:MAG TPA: DUF2007 domain-containing protein [Kofleriaceae bacterium]|nr:DUF2007 domain-containing protein [Kofleriaceae bacterium]